MSDSCFSSFALSCNATYSGYLNGEIKTTLNTQPGGGEKMQFLSGILATIVSFVVAFLVFCPIAA
jgi:hypothetical protein